MRSRFALLCSLMLAQAACKAKPKEAPPPEVRDDATAAIDAAAPAPPVAVDAASATDPTDPKELELARKAAVLEQRTADAVRLCGKEDLSKVGSQGALGCVLAACREKEQAKAAAWAAFVDGPLRKKAREVCAASGVAL